MVKIAVFGANGALGQPVLDALTSDIVAGKVEYPVKVLTRDPSKNTSTDKIQYFKGDLTEEGVASIVDELKGFDVIVELLGANPQLFAVTEKIAEQVKPKLFIPSQFGLDILVVNTKFPGFLKFKTDHSDNIRALGIKSVDFYTSFFAKPGSYLYEFIATVGADPATNTVTYAGNPDQQLSVTTVGDVGRAVAAVAVTPVSELPDTIRTESQKVSIKEIVTKYEKSHNVTFDVKNISSEELLSQAQEKYKNFSFNDFIFYLWTFSSQGLTLHQKTDNELINPGEKLWKWDNYLEN